MSARRSLPLLLAFLFLLSPALSARAEQKVEEVTTIQLPSNPVSDFAAYYQSITGKRIVADASVMAGGPNLSLVVPQSVTKKEAAELIKSVLVLNGFTLVDVDDDTVKLLGPSKFPRTESVQLYTDPSQLPAGDEVVSYFMPLRYLKSDEAANAFQNYAPFRPFGSVIQVPSVNAIVITETATFVRRLIELKDVIDVQGARTATKFFPLVRADAENIVEILTKLFEKPDGAIAVGSAPVNRPPNQPGQPNQPAAPTGGTTLSGPAQKVQVFAVKRTNTVMVVAPEEQMPYIKDLIDNLDSEVNFDKPLEQPLRFVKAGDVLPVLANMLAEGEDKKNGGTPQIAGVDNNSSNQQNSNSSNSSNGNSGYNGSGGSGGNLSVDNTTSFNAEQNTPQSVTVGNARIIADRSVNKIIVIGPPESKLKAKQVLEMLDQRPKQVYLAVVIGQLTLGKNLEFGINYLYKGTNPEAGFIRALGTGTTGDISNLIKSRNGSLDVVPDTGTVTNTAVNAAASAASTAVPILSGLTVYGSIANSVDILARAMAATNKFQVISRPVVYTANGQAAKISSGQSVPVASGTLTSAVDANNSNNLGSSIASNVEYKDIVLELEVQPLINSDHEVTLRIKQKNDTIQGTTTVAGNSYPTLGVQGLNTTITVPNRNTVVLGGLISEQDDLTQTGIPLLKDIPYVGALFGSTVKNKTRRELIIMIQPFIVDTDEKLEEVNYIERANTGFKGEHLFDQPVPIQKALPPTPEDLTNPKLR
jgi:type II secretion system protein D